MFVPFTRGCSLSLSLLREQLCDFTSSNLFHSPLHRRFSSRRAFPRGKGQRISFPASLSAITTETLIVTWQPNRMDRGGFSWTWTLEKGRVTDGVKSAGSWQEPEAFRG